jgi:hypothetical protein
MLRLPNPAAQQACSEHNIAVECLKLFPRYRFEVTLRSCSSFACCCVVRSLAPRNRWHSILHSTVLNMITAVLSSSETLEAALRGGLLQASAGTLRLSAFQCDPLPGNHRSCTARHSRWKASPTVVHGSSGQDCCRAQRHCQEGEGMLQFVVL